MVVRNTYRNSTSICAPYRFANFNMGMGGFKMNAVDFMMDWFMPILMMVSIVVIIISWAIALVICVYKEWRK